MVTVRPAEPADLPAVAGDEDAADALFVQRFGAVDWPPPTPGEARAAEPGLMLVAVHDDTDTGAVHEEVRDAAATRSPS